MAISRSRLRAEYSRLPPGGKGKEGVAVCQSWAAAAGSAGEEASGRS